MHITHRRRFGAGRPARVIAVSAVIAVGLVGCSGGSEESGPEESGPAVEEEEIVLDFPSWQVNEPGNGDVLRAIVDEFESRHDNVTVNLYYVSNDDFQNTLVTRLASGNPPDVIASGNHFYAFAATGQLESLTSRLEESGLMDTWQQSLLDGTTYDGEILSLPLHAHSRMMYYNTDYFAQAGIDAPPTTPEELEADVEALAALGLEGVSPWGATTTSHSNLFGESNAFVLGMGGGWIKDGEWAVTSPETVAALELYRTLTKQAPPGNDGGKYRQLFADGRIAAIHDGNWVQAFLDEVAPGDVHDKLVPAPSPFPKAVSLLGVGLSIPTGISEERKDLVWELIQIAAEPEFQAMWPEMINAAPGLKDVITDEMSADNPVLGVLGQNMANSVPEFPDSQNFKANFGEIQQRIVDAIMRLQTGDEPTMTVLEDLQSQLEAITEP